MNTSLLCLSFLLPLALAGCGGRSVLDSNERFAGNGGDSAAIGGAGGGASGAGGAIGGAGGGASGASASGASGASPCSAGPCCSGSYFATETTNCADSVEYQCASSSCGGVPQRRAVTQFCSGRSANCDGSTHTGAWQDLAACSDTEICAANGGAAPTCSVCKLGCGESGCKTPLWIFATNAVYQGNFGEQSGARVTADAKCADVYEVEHVERQCSDIHALIQVDNADDTLLRMAASFRIPVDVPVLRASDGTKVANQWSDLIDRGTPLLAPVSTSGTPLFFWSGRGMTANRNCNQWQSPNPGFIGDTGDATKTSSWLSQQSFTCDSITPHLLCVCWSR